jgi:PAS domain S-box-containing protein
MPRGSKRKNGQAGAGRPTRGKPRSRTPTPPPDQQLIEALEQQAATSEILRIIRQSPNDAQPVFDTIAEQAMRLCRALHGGVMRFDGKLIHLAAHVEVSPAFAEALHRLYPRPPGRGMSAARAILTRATVHIPDIERDPEYEFSKTAREAGFRSALAVPMLRDGEAIGAIVVFRGEAAPFSARHIGLLQTFADQAVIAIENARLFTELEARNSQLAEALEQQTATGEILRVISGSPTDIRPVLDTLVKSATRFCGASDAVIFLREGDNLRVTAHHGPIPQEIGRLRTLGRGTVVGRSLLDQRTIHMADLQAEVDEFPEGSAVARRLGHRTILSVPLMREKAAIGVIQLRRAEVSPFSDKQTALLQTFAAQAVIAIENVRLFTELEARNRDLTETLEQQTATGEILKVISSSPTDVQPVFDIIAASAVTLCGTEMATVTRFDGEWVHLDAVHGINPEGVAALRQAFPMRPGSGVGAARVIQEGSVVHIPDVLADPQYRMQGAAIAGGFRGLMGVPMLRDGRVVGAITVGRTTPGLFSETQVQLLRTFADQAVIAIENVRLFTELEARNSQLAESLEQQTATAEILSAISSSPTDIRPVLETVVRAAARFCGAPDVAIVRRDGEEVRGAAAVGPFGEELAARSGGIEGLQYPLTRGSVSGRAIIERRSIHVHDLAAESEDEFPMGRALQRRFGHHTTLATPLLREGVSLGAIMLFRTETRPFSDRQLELAKIFADQAVIAIENVRLFQELQARNAALSEALEQQTATGEVLKVISRSTVDLQPVLETVVENATRLCGAVRGHIFRVDGDFLRFAAAYGAWPGFQEYLAQHPARIGPGTAAGRAAAERRVIHIQDVRDESGYQYGELVKRQDYRTVLAVPILREDALLGIVAILKSNVEPFTDKQIELVTTFADQAAIAIENVRLLTELQARNHALTESLEQQTATSDILRVISSSPTDAQPVFDIIAERATKLCDAEVAVVSRFDGTLLQLAAIHGVTREGVEAVRRVFPEPIDFDNLTARAFRERAVVHVADVLADQTYAMKGEAVTAGWRSGLAAPMFRDGQVIGVIFVGRSTAGLFSDQRVELLKTFADQAVIAIENVRLFRELEVRNRDLTESLDQQTATGEILRVISSSPTDVQPVFDTIVESAVRLCNGLFSALFRYDGELIHQVAQYNFTPEGLEQVRRLYPVRPNRGHGSARAILERTIVHIPDFDADPEYRAHELTRAVGLRSGLYVPMMKDGEPIGVIMVGRGEPGPFSDAQVTLLQTFADQAVIAIENVRLFTALDARNRELTESLEQQTATGEILRVISSSPTDVQPVFDTIAKAVLHLCGAELCQVFRVDAGMLHFVGSQGHTAEGLAAAYRAFPRPVDRGTTAGRAVLSAAIAQIEDVRTDAEYAVGDVARAMKFRALVAVPMIRDGRAIGAISVARHEPGRFSDRQMELLRIFADQAVIAIENVRLFTEVQERNRDLTNALEQQTATSEVLRVISGSATDTQPVFDAIVRSAVRLCQARFALVYQLHDDVIHFAAHHNLPVDAMAQFQATFPQRLSESRTLVAQAILRREVINVPDIAAQPEVSESVRELARLSGYRSVLALPIMREGRALGAIAIARSGPDGEPYPFSGDDIPLLQTFSEQAGIAIEKVRLFNELEARTAQLTRSVGELQALGEVSQAVSSTLDLDAVLETIVGRAVELSGSDQGVIYEYDEPTRTFHQRATHRMSAEYLETMRAAPIRLGEGVMGRAGVTRAPVQVADLQAELELVAPQVRRQLVEQRMGSLLAVPLVREGRLLGGLVTIRRERGAFSPEAVAMLQTFATQSVLAIHNARLFREIQQQKQYADALVETSPVAIVTLDLDGLVTSWNPGAERLFGYAPAEALGQRMENLISTPEAREEMRANVRLTMEGEGIRRMGRRARKDRTEVDLEISSVPVVVDGARVGMIAIYHDVTELLQAREEAEAANEAKGAFLATMSHEIRTPMNAVIGMSGLLLNTPLTDEQREYAEVVRQSGDALLTVINDILDFSKIEAGRLELESQPFDLRECVEGALDLVASRAAEKGLDLAYLLGEGMPAAIVGDVTRLRQVLLNLLSNAVKFTEAGEVVLSVGAQRPDGPDRPYELSFSVRDTGIGIPPDRLDRLFQSFSQIDTSTTRRYGGTGLGLAISQRLTELMGGRVEVTSEVGRGSDFHFTIRAPAAAAPLPTRRDLSGVQPSLRGKRVLVVDDNATNRRILTTYLATWGMPARATGSPGEALEWIRADERFDAAILDMHMPEMDGVTLARAIARHPSAATLPLVLFTSLGRREALADNTSFAAYLHKPIKPSQLFDALVSVLAEQPVHVAPRAAGRSELDPGMAGRLPLRILLAEDNVVNQKLALRFLAQMGYRADLAGNGLEALDAVERQTYDVVLMDVQMPEMDGLEASREINRRWAREARPRIVAMTANAMQGDRELCVAAGMDDYVAKPIRVEELVAALERCRRRGDGPGGGAKGAGADAADDSASEPVDRAALDRLVETMGGAFVGELIDTFGQDAGELIATLRRTLAAADLDGFRRAAHSLKSTSQSLGATGLAARARELETAARAGTLDGAPDRVRALAQHYEAVARCLGAIRRDLPA